MKNNNYKPKEFAELINISVRTLQRWDIEGKLKAFRTPTDRRYYTYEQYLEYIGGNTVTFKCESDEKLKELIKLTSGLGGISIEKSIQDRN